VVITFRHSFLAAQANSATPSAVHQQNSFSPAAVVASSSPSEGMYTNDKLIEIIEP